MTKVKTTIDEPKGGTFFYNADKICFQLVTVPGVDGLCVQLGPAYNNRKQLDRKKQTLPCPKHKTRILLVFDGVIYKSEDQAREASNTNECIEVAKGCYLSPLKGLAAWFVQHTSSKSQENCALKVAKEAGAWARGEKVPEGYGSTWFPVFLVQTKPIKPGELLKYRYAETITFKDVRKPISSSGIKRPGRPCKKGSRRERNCDGTFV